MKRTRQHAFTLIEILVAIVILLLLAALLYPVFARARENGRRAMCISNLHQIGLAVDMYRQDYDGMEPEKGVPLSHSQLGLPHVFSIEVFYNQYIKSRQVLFCPSYPGDATRLGSTYILEAVASEYHYAEEDWEAIAALRGPDYPMAICESHNGPQLPPNLRRSNEILHYHVLRISGQVSTRKARADEDMNLRTW